MKSACHPAQLKKTPLRGAEKLHLKGERHTQTEIEQGALCLSAQGHSPARALTWDKEGSGPYDDWFSFHQAPLSPLTVIDTQCVPGAELKVSESLPQIVLSHKGLLFHVPQTENRACVGYGPGCGQAVVCTGQCDLLSPSRQSLGSGDRKLQEERYKRSPQPQPIFVLFQPSAPSGPTPPPRSLTSGPTQNTCPSRPPVSSGQDTVGLCVTGGPSLQL